MSSNQPPPNAPDATRIAPATLAVLDALRHPQDADQLRRAIAALCRVDPSFGSHLARCVLEAAAESGAEPGRAARFLESSPPPGELSCTRSPLLEGDEGRISLRWGRGRLGSADLRLVGSGFGLALECRLAGSLTADDRERYRRLGEPLLVILPEPAATGDERLAANENWLGTVAWSGLAERLRRIPVDPAWAWLVDRIGDELYAAAAGEPEAGPGQSWAEFLDSSRNRILEVVREVVHEAKPGLSLAAAAEFAGPVTEIDDGGRLLIEVPARPEGWLFIGLSGRTEQPQLRVGWEPLSSSKPLRAAIAGLRAEQPLFQLTKLGIHRHHMLEAPVLDNLLEKLAADLRAMAAHGLLIGAPRRTG